MWRREHNHHSPIPKDNSNDDTKDNSKALTDMSCSEFQQSSPKDFFASDDMSDNRATSTDFDSEARQMMRETETQSSVDNDSEGGMSHKKRTRKKKSRLGTYSMDNDDES